MATKDTIKAIKRAKRIGTFGLDMRTKTVPNKRKDSHKSRRDWKLNREQ